MNKLPGADADDTSVRMEVRDDGGRTDLELDTGDALIIVEAKRGWLLPRQPQLAAYAPRIADRGSGVLVTLSSASDDWAAASVPSDVNGVPVRHLSWAVARRLLAARARQSRGQERFWLNEFSAYLKGALRMRDVADSRTYSVAISQARPERGAKRTFREWVVDEGIYFHPFKKGWPRQPPNFLAFRWDKQVQRIQRVVSAEVVPSLATALPDIPSSPTSDVPHAIYRLGPPLPGTPIPSGKPYRASHRWVLLDQLLTAGSLAAAMEGTRRLVGRELPNDADAEDE
ncbi:MAG: hypothetical protein DLM56_13945 [Pseudonocardiales bacterium]|nr:MAG: hypothetical protein DLM56_13945 [Pseudonocardiales bacterium]